MAQNPKKCNALSDEATEAIAAIVLIAVVVSGLVFWLMGFSS